MAMILAIASSIFIQTTPVPTYRQATDVAIITIEGAVDSVTAQSFKRRLASVKDADAIVIELDTPGGDLMSTLQICYAIKNSAPNNTVAWINPHAFSAGTIIALACRQIIVAPGSTFGDAAPINATGQPIPATERAKIESPVLAEVIDSARRNHYDEHLVEAFVSVGIELWLIQNVQTGDVVCVNRNEFKTIFGKDPPQHFSPIGTNQTSNNLLSPFFETLSALQDSTPRSTPTWEPDFAQQLPTSRRLLTANDAMDWQLVRQIVPNDRLLTLKPDEGKMYGLVHDVVSDDIALQEWFGATSIVRLRPSWSENLVSILVSWPIRLVLIALFLICVVVEMATGGSGLFGVGATVSMALLIGAPWLAGLAQWWDIILVLGGLTLVAVEILVIPGAGFVGFTGVAMLFAGMLGSFISGDLNSSAGQTQLLTGLATIVGGCLLACIACWIILKQFGNAHAITQFVLEDAVGMDAPPPTSDLAMGDVAIAITNLRPSGKIKRDDSIYDATTSGSWITQGSKVRIMQTGMTIKVEEIKA
jgi:membrane-bound ClpP family serine protease